MDIVPFPAQLRAASAARDDLVGEAELSGSLEAFLAEYVTAGRRGGVAEQVSGVMRAEESADGSAPVAAGVAAERAQALAGQGPRPEEKPDLLVAAPDAPLATVIAQPVAVALPGQPAAPAQRAEVPAPPVNAAPLTAVSAHASPSRAAPGYDASVAAHAPDQRHPPAATCAPGMPAGSGLAEVREARGSGRSGTDTATEATGVSGLAPRDEVRSLRPQAEAPAVPMSPSDLGARPSASGAADLRVRQHGDGPPDAGNLTRQTAGDLGRTAIRILDAPSGTSGAAVPIAVSTGAGAAGDGRPLQHRHMPAPTRASVEAAVPTLPVAADPVQVTVAAPPAKPAPVAGRQPEVPAVPLPDPSAQVTPSAHAGVPHVCDAAARPVEPMPDDPPTPSTQPATGTSAETVLTIVSDPAARPSEDALTLAPTSESARPPAGPGGELRAAAAQPALPHGLGPRLAETVAQFPDRPVEVTLSPEELGRVRLSLVTHEGTLTMSVQADRPETLDLLRRNIDQLAQDFRDLGFRDLNFSFGDRPPGPAPERDIRSDEAEGRAGIPQDLNLRPGVAEAVAAGPAGLDLRL